MFSQVQRPFIFLSGSGGKNITVKKALEGVSREVNCSSGTVQHLFSDSALFSEAQIPSVMVTGVKLVIVLVAY